MSRVGHAVLDEDSLCRRRVRHVGQPVGSRVNLVQQVIQAGKLDVQPVLGHVVHVYVIVCHYRNVIYVVLYGRMIRNQDKMRKFNLDKSTRG